MSLPHHLTSTHPIPPHLISSHLIYAGRRLQLQLSLSLCIPATALASACSFSSLSISAAALALGSSGAGRIALLGARSAHRPHGRVARLRLRLQLSLHLGRCSRPRLERCRPHRAAQRAAQLTALTGVSLASACSFSSLSISAATLALGSSGAGRIALLGARSAHRPHGRVARLRLQLQLSLYLGCCSRPRLERCRSHRAARRALSSPPSRA